jgi:hypothetical protein
MKLTTKNVCEGCNTVFVSPNHLTTHYQICKDYKIVNIVKKHTEELKEKEEKHKEELKEKDKKYEMLELSYQHLRHDYNELKVDSKIKYNELKEEHQTKTNKYESVLERLAFNKPNNEETNDNSNIIDEKEKIINDIQEYKFGNDFIVPIRSDGMINATFLCKAAGKRLDHYKENLQTKDYLHELSSVTGIPVSELFNPIIGGKYPGTWVHRNVGYHLAQWISPKFAVQVSLILDELFITSKVEIYNEKSADEVDNEYKRQITTLKTTLNTNKEQYQKLLIKHNFSLKTHRYIKFKKTDPCFYIIDSGVDCDCLCYKFGITGLDQGNNIDDRLRCHRTLWPKLKVRYLLFIKDVEMIEKNFKMMFEKEINPNGHEIIEGVTFDEMIVRIEKLFDILSIKEYHIMPEEKLKEYNDYVETTIKAI